MELIHQITQLGLWRGVEIAAQMADEAICSGARHIHLHGPRGVGKTKVAVVLYRNGCMADDRPENTDPTLNRSPREPLSLTVARGPIRGAHNIEVFYLCPQKSIRNKPYIDQLSIAQDIVLQLLRIHCRPELNSSTATLRTVTAMNIARQAIVDALRTVDRKGPSDSIQSACLARIAALKAKQLARLSDGEAEYVKNVSAMPIASRLESKRKRQ